MRDQILPLKTQFCLLLKLRADAISENMNSNSPLNPELLGLLEGAWGFIWVLVGLFLYATHILKVLPWKEAKHLLICLQA